MNVFWKHALRSACFAFLLLALAAAAGCGESTTAASATVSSETPTVTTVRPERRSVRHSLEQPGQIEGFEQTPLYAKISGYVRKLNVDIGDRVRKDQVLAELSVPELEEQLRQKEALVAQARAEIENSKRMTLTAEATVGRSQAAVKLAQAGVTRADANFAYWKSESERSPSAFADQLHRSIVCGTDV